MCSMFFFARPDSMRNPGGAAMLTCKTFDILELLAALREGSFEWWRYSTFVARVL